MKFIVFFAVVAMFFVLGCAEESAKTPSKGPAKAATDKPVTELKIEDLKEGTEPAAKTSDTVVVHYTGWLRDGTKFDSSVGGDPLSFRLGAGKVIKGWDQGVAGMKVGGKRKLTIPPDLGYGARGTPGGPIPPNAELIFEVELLKIQ